MKACPKSIGCPKGIYRFKNWNEMNAFDDYYAFRSTESEKKQARMNRSEYESLLHACLDLSEKFPDICFMGSLAVDLHAANLLPDEELQCFANSADFYVSLRDMADLRDREVIAPNRMLKKSQLIKEGFLLNIYLERYADLIIPYKAIAEQASSFSGLTVSALEHLLPLTLEALIGRSGTESGNCDARDVVRIACIAMSNEGYFKPELAKEFLKDEHVSILKDVESGPFALIMSNGKDAIARQIRGRLHDFVSIMS